MFFNMNFFILHINCALEFILLIKLFEKILNLQLQEVIIMEEFFQINMKA